MFEIRTTTQFLKDRKLCKRRGLDIGLLDSLIFSLFNTGTVPQVHKPHILTGKLTGKWECHIKPDWLLIWTKDGINKTITLYGTGSHSDLFR